MASIYSKDLPEYPPISAQLKREGWRQRLIAKTRSFEIDFHLKQDARRAKKFMHLTILLLGPGDAGKSTVLKQMILHHRNGFTAEERQELAGVMRMAMFSSLQLSIRRKPELNLTEEEKAITQSILESELLISHRDLDPQKIQLVQKLLQSKNCQPIFELIPKLQDIFTQAYSPTNDETIFHIDQKFWHIIDVAGQKDKRAKWTQYIEKWTQYMEKKVSGVIFVFSCAAYNEYMEEQPGVNKIDDALQLFASVCASHILQLENIIVLLNKSDLLDEKLKKYQISEQDRKSYFAWLQRHLTKVASDHEITTFQFKTNATDVTLMRNVLFSINETIIRGKAKEIGLF
ncbi:G-protein alpha subunit-domain-containing protein [Gorgonomyces haynaldii]|nr:G-protein alpha subunit-domain-containing protein [Gorgonomyces haynaldii]